MNAHDTGNTAGQEERLVRALRQRADGLPGPAGDNLGLDAIRGRARTVRRTRVAAATLGAAAAVAAVAVPLGVLTGGSSTDPPPPAQSPSSEVTPSDDASAKPSEAVDPPGAATLPPLAYAVGDLVVPADEDSFSVPDGASTGFAVARFGDGWLVSLLQEGSVRLLDSAGGDVASWSGVSGEAVVDPTLSAAAWVGADGAVSVLRVGDEEPTTLPGELPSTEVGAGTVVGVHGDCVEECTVYASSYVAPDASGEGGGEQHVRLGLDGPAEPVLPDAIALTDVSPDGRLVTGLVSVDQEAGTTCSAAFDVESGERLWETCDARSLSFSPDGERLLGFDAFSDGANYSGWRVLDATTGAVEQRFDGVVFDAAWDVDGSWLVIRGESGTEQARVERWAADGDGPEEVAPVRDRQVSEQTYRLERR